MKRLLISALVLTAVSALAMNSFAAATTTATVNVTVTVVSGTVSVINLNPATVVAFGPVKLGSVNVTPNASRVTFENNGDVPETFSLSATISPATWPFAGVGTVGADTFRLSAVWMPWNYMTPQTTDFVVAGANNDIITGAVLKASAADVFGRTTDPANVQGNNVEANYTNPATAGQRALYLQFEAPASLTAASGAPNGPDTAQTIVVTVTAIAS